MKLSRYIEYVWTKNEKLIIYNLFNKGMVSLDKDMGFIFEKEILNNNFNNKKLVDFLYKEKILYDDKFDELEILKNIDMELKKDESKLTLTIALTTNCNFNCVYCYQNELNPINMTYDTAYQLISYIKNFSKNLKDLKINWYGGEPLLKIDIIEFISNEIIKFCEKNKINYNSSIITNGYLLNKEFVKKVKDLKIESAQITLDGYKDVHNEKRPLKTGNGTYERILENIKEIKNLINIMVRINVDKININKIDLLLDDLEKHDLKKEITVYSSIVKRNEKYIDNCIVGSNYFNSIYKINQKILSRGFKYSYILYEGTGYCAAIYNFNLTIDPQGYIYKCPLEIGTKNKSVGHISKGIDGEKNKRWQEYIPYYKKICIDCKIFPLCKGGCPNKNVQKEVKVVCSELKYNLKNYIKLYF